MVVRMLAGLAAALLVSSVHAQPAPASRRDEIVKRGTLRVVMTGDHLPFTYLGKTARKFRGFDVDMSMEDGSFKKIHAARFD